MSLLKSVLVNGVWRDMLLANYTPDYAADLLTTLQPGTGTALPTYTQTAGQHVRLTANQMSTALANEAGFWLGRRVHTYSPYSDDLTKATVQLVSTGTSVVDYQTLGYPATQLSFIAFEFNAMGFTTVAPFVGEFIWSCDVAIPASGGITSLYINVDPGDCTLTADADFTLTPTTTWQRIEMHANVTAVGGTWRFRLGNNGTTAGNLLVRHLQIENMTGKTIHLAPSEFVSGGVLTAQPYHGSGVDFVQYFGTENGNTVSANLVTDGTGAALTGLLGLPLLPAYTNLLVSSNDLTATAWTKGANTTVTANALAGPSGRQTATHLVMPANSGTYAGNLIALSAITYTFNCWVMNNGGSTDLVIGCWSDITTGTTTSVTTLALMASWAYYRWSFTIATAGNYYIGFDGSSNANAYDCYVWGCMTVAGDVDYPVIDTTTATASNIAQRLTFPVSGTLVTGNQALSVEWTPLGNSLGTVYLFGSTVDANNGTYLLHDGTNLIFRKRIAGTNNDCTIAASYTKNTTYKCAFRNDTVNGMDVFFNGAKGTSVANTSALQLGTNFDLGSDGSGANPACGLVSSLKSYQKQVSDSTLT